MSDYDDIDYAGPSTLTRMRNEIAGLKGKVEQMECELKLAYAAVEKLKAENAALKQEAERSTRRLVELSAPGSIGAFASRDHWKERAEKAEAENAALKESIEQGYKPCQEQLEGWLEKANAENAALETDLAKKKVYIKLFHTLAYIEQLERENAQLKFHNNDLQGLESLRKLAKKKVYIKLFHGRSTPDEQLDDWGFEGPEIGPLDYVHTTYLCDVKFGGPYEVMERFFPEFCKEGDWQAPKGSTVDGHFKVEGDLIVYDGKYYGDFSVYTKL